MINPSPRAILEGKARRMWISLKRAFRSLLAALWPYFIFLVVITAIVFYAVVARYWGYLYNSGETVSSSSLIEVVGTLALIFGGAIAALLTIWRSLVSERQSKTARLSLLDGRLQQSAERLGAETLFTRLSAIQALRRLAEVDEDEYYIPVMELLCAFVRHPAGSNRNSLPPEDIMAAIRAIGARNPRRLCREQEAHFVPDLSGANLRGVSIERLNLARVNLTGAVLIDARLNNVDLSLANLSSAKLACSNLVFTILTQASLKDADLYHARLSGNRMNGTVLRDTDLSGAFLSGIRGLTLERLLGARVDPIDPPKFADLFDAGTGEEIGFGLPGSMEWGNGNFMYSEGGSRINHLRVWWNRIRVPLHRPRH